MIFVLKRCSLSQFFDKMYCCIGFVTLYIGNKPTLTALAVVQFSWEFWSWGNCAEFGAPIKFIVYQMGRLCGGAHEISGIKAPIFLWVGGGCWRGGEWGD